MRRHIVFILFYFLLWSRAENDLPPALLEFIESQEEVVKSIAGNATRFHASRVELVKRCKCSRHGCSNDFPDSTCEVHLGTPTQCSTDGRRLDVVSTIVRTPPGSNPGDLRDSIKENICVYAPLSDVFKSYGTKDRGWIYFGTRDGHFREFPGSAVSRDRETGEELLGYCRPFDPRLRPWYIAASTGPKDIVLVVDKSGSMNDFIGLNKQTKWDLTRDAVGRILDTFTFTDFVNVVMFSDGARPLWSASGLVRGRGENIAALKEAMADEFPSGKTNFTAAFTTAFTLLTEGCNEEPKSCTNCQKIIIFLTDGKDTSGENGEAIRPTRMAAWIDELQSRLERQTKRRASIFTYSMSDQADDAIPRQIACANDGAWSFIGANTNALDALNSYYLYIADGRKAVSPVWVEPFEDFNGLGLITTVALPVYALGTDSVPDVFLGVAGHDVLLSEFQINSISSDEALNAIIDRSERCTPANNTACEFQVFRNVQDAKGVCADPYPVVTVRPPDLAVDDPFVECYEFNGQYYKRYSDEVTWDMALELCADDRGALVSVTGADELAFVANLASADGSWIGSQYIVSEGFVWLDTAINQLPERSAFWGVGEPQIGTGDRHCVTVDTRGTIGNLASRQCDTELSYVCKYKRERHCAAGLANFPEQGYFKVPPLNKCLVTAEELDNTRPIDEAMNLSSQDVLCPLGKGVLNNNELTCCKKPQQNLDLSEENDSEISSFDQKNGEETDNVSAAYSPRIVIVAHFIAITIAIAMCVRF